MDKYERRFWTKVLVGDGCWEWMAGKNADGYGYFWVNGHGVRSHKWIWERTNGPVPAGMVLRHSCDNRACVRPGHLEVGTNQDNTNDMMIRSRHVPPKGERNGQAKVSDRIVREIRSRYVRRGHPNMADLAAEFGVSEDLVSLIVRRKIWTHVEDSEVKP